VPASWGDGRPGLTSGQSAGVGGESAVAAPEAAQGLSPGPAATFATTEHFTLQTARAVTVSEANGRTNTYLAALSSGVIALAFIGQVSQIGSTFHAFALILLPVLALLGVSTFLRLVQSSLEDLAYAQRIARLRGFYLRVSPELEPYIVMSRRGPVAAQADVNRSIPSAWQLTLTAAGTVAVVNSVVVAACVGLALDAAGVPWLTVTLTAAAIVGAAALALHELHHRRAFVLYRPDAVDLAAIVEPPLYQVYPAAKPYPDTADPATGGRT
jgi:hypothetical protein